jgi:polyferredoxin
MNGSDKFTAPEGLPTDGCAMQLRASALPDNRECVMCMECLRACPNGNIQVGGCGAIHCRV